MLACSPSSQLLTIAVSMSPAGERGAQLLSFTAAAAAFVVSASIAALRAEVDDLGVAQAGEIGFGEVRRIDLHLVGILGQLGDLGLGDRGRQGLGVLGQDQRRARGLGLFLLLARNTAQPDQGLGHYFAFEGAEIGHGIGAFGRGAGRKREAGDERQREQSGAGHGPNGGRPPGQVITHAKSLLPLAPGLISHHGP